MTNNWIKLAEENKIHYVNFNLVQTIKLIKTSDTTFRVIIYYSRDFYDIFNLNSIKEKDLIMLEIEKKISIIIPEEVPKRKEKKVKKGKVK